MKYDPDTFSTDLSFTILSHLKPTQTSFLSNVWLFLSFFPASFPLRNTNSGGVKAYQSSSDDCWCVWSERRETDEAQRSLTSMMALLCSPRQGRCCVSSRRLRAAGRLLSTDADLLNARLGPWFPLNSRFSASTSNASYSSRQEEMFVTSLNY